MKTLRALLILWLIIITVGCYSMGSVPPDVDYDYNVSIDFSSINSYNWHQLSERVDYDQLVVARVKKAVDTRLQGKGIKFSPDDPDFLITMYGGTRKEYTTEWKTWGAELWYEEGRIKLAFFDARSNDLIWWAETRANVHFEMTPEEKDKIVEDAVTRILDKFPPNPPE
jgi:hypothetical protein